MRKKVRKIKNKLLLFVFAVNSLLLLICLFSFIIGSRNVLSGTELNSIGIIGGADGPTSIYFPDIALGIPYVLVLIEVLLGGFLLGSRRTGKIKKVDLDKKGWTYSSYVQSENLIFTSICSGSAETIGESTRQALDQMSLYLEHAGASLDDLVKVTVTFKIGENFDEMKPVFKLYFPKGFPARNTILVPQFLNDSIKLQIEGIAYKS